MSWWNPSDWFLSDEEVKRGAELDAQIAKLDREKWESGKITTAEYERRQAAQAENAAGTYKPQVDDAFLQGWEEGKKDAIDAIAKTTSGVTKAAGDILAAPVRGILGGIPWWLWLILAAGAALYLGALPRILGALKSK